MECSVFKAKILTKSSIKIANASLFEILIKDPQVFDLIRLVDSLALKQISHLAEAGRILEKSLNRGR